MIAPGSDLHACAQIVEKGDPLRFRTVMAAPLDARLKLFPLYAFNIEVARAPYLTQEPLIAEMRLQWWRDVLEEIVQGTVRRHEVATPLATVLTPEQAERLDVLVAARIWDCHRAPFDDHAHMNRYIHQTSGGLMCVASQLLGGPTEAAEQAGFALGVFNWFRAVTSLEAQGRVPLVDGTPDGVKDLAQAGVEALESARRNRVPKTALPAFWPATGVGRRLRQVLSSPSTVASGALTSAPRAALLWASLRGNW